MGEILHVGMPTIADKERFLRMASDIIDRKWLTNNGEYVQELEARLCTLLGVKHVIAVCNATVGLEIVLNVGTPKKGSVVVPDFTFIASAHAAVAAGHKVVVADVHRSNHCLDPLAVEEVWREDIVAILGVHLWGNSCFVDRLQRVAEERQVKLFFDAAHALGATHNGRPIGSFGNAEVFSFHATKIVNGFEGGAISTNDDELAQKCRLARNFGFIGTDKIASHGTNGKMSEVSAAMALVNLDALEKLIAINRERHDQYSSLSRNVRGFSILPASDGNNFHYCVAELDESLFGHHRDGLVEWLWENDVRARKYFYPGVRRSPPYKFELLARCPVSEALCGSVVVLPTGPSLSPGDVERVVGLISQFQEGICR